MDLSDELLPDLLTWGRDLKGFKREHAISAMYVVKSCLNGISDKDGRMIQGLGTQDMRAAFAFALDLTMIFWLDDCFDDQILEPDQLEAVGAVLAGSDVGTTPETKACQAVHRLLTGLARSVEDGRLMLDCGAGSFRAWQKEALLSSAQIEMSYVEYLDNGIDSIAALRILATMSALWGLGMAARFNTLRFQRFLRHLSIAIRLYNDLISLEKERHEKCRANAVLVVERVLPGTGARVFLEEDLRGYERLLAQDIECMEKDDPLRRAAEILMVMQERYYGMDRRYASGDSNTDLTQGA